jgi:hypothetical protein
MARNEPHAPKVDQRAKLATGEIGTVVEVVQLPGKPAGPHGGFTVDKSPKRNAPKTLCVRVRVGDRGKGVLRTAESVQPLKTPARKQRQQPPSPETVAEHVRREGRPAGNEPAVLPPGPHRARVLA